MQLIGHGAQHYASRKWASAGVYRWCPEAVVFECSASGGQPYRAGFMTGFTGAFECGADSPIHDEPFTCTWLGDEPIHPLRCAEEREGAGLPIWALG